MDLFSQTHLTEIILPVHNRNGNDAHYQSEKNHFKNQTEIVLAHLMNGERVTGKEMFELHGIQDIRPRLAAIRKSLIGTNKRLVSERIKGAHGSKISWLESFEL